MTSPVRHQAIIDGLVIGFTQKRTAELAGCSLTTVARVALKHKDHIRAERDALAERTSAQLLGLVPAAVAELERLLVTGGEATRLNACKFVISTAYASREAIEFEVRVQAVEAESRSEAA